MKTMHPLRRLADSAVICCRISLLLGAAALAFQTVRADPLDDSRKPLGGWAKYVGIPGGIPTTGYTQFCNVKTLIPGSKLVAVGDGVTDDTAALQTAIDLCPMYGIVYIPPGNYKLSAALNYTPPNSAPYRPLILRGAGPDKTKLYPAQSDGNVINIVGSGGCEAMRGQANMVRGDTNLVATWFHPSIVINITNMVSSTGGWMQVNHYTNGSHWCQFSKLAAVNTSTNTVTIDPPIQSSSGSKDVPVSLAWIPNNAYWVGVEDLYIERPNTTTSGNGIFIKGAVQCWVKNVEISNVFNWCVRFEQSLQCEVRDSFFRDCMMPNGGGGNSGYGVGFREWCSYNLVQNNIFRFLRHAMVCEGGSMNVFGYNYSIQTINEGQAHTDYLESDMITHGLFAQFNLFEGNVAQRLNFDNAEWWEGKGGENNVAFRNWVQRIPINPTGNGLSAIAVQWQNYSESIVGNILGSPNQVWEGYDATQRPPQKLKTVREIDWWKDSIQDIDPSNANEQAVRDATPAPSSTLLWHMNWSFYDNGATNYLDPKAVDTDLPKSYYLSAKPSWWDSGPWPAIGPDVVPNTGGNPAQRRYAQMTGATPPKAPSNLRVTH